MSIYKGNKKVVALYKGATPIIRRYKGTQLIYDATPSDEPINDTLSFAWSGTSSSQTFKINTKIYTASTNPYSATLTELGVDKFTNANTMFYNKRAITAVTSIPDTSNVTDMYYMFRYLGVKELDVTKTMNTSACTNMSFMFAYCPNLTSLDLSSFDTSKVNNMQMMFYNDTKLDYLDISGWDLRNVTSKSGMFGNGCKPSKVIMNGCDCDTILFIRQEIANNGVDHTKVVQTDTVCPLSERKEDVTYNVYADPSCAWNKYVYPDSVNKVITIIDEYGVTSRETFTLSSTEYTVKFELKGGTPVEGDNESDEARVIFGNINYNGEIIYTYEFTQNAKPTEVDSDFYLSCDSPKDVVISELIIDMNDVPPADEWYFARFSRTPNGYGDCNECEYGDISISLHEDDISGEINMQITDLQKNDEGKYVLTFNEPYYFQCAEMNFPFNKVLCITNKSAPCGDTISFTSYSSSQRITINEREYDLYNMNDYTETDGRYVFNKSLSELTNGNINTSDGIYSMRRMFNGCSRIISIDNLPCTSNVTNMSQMFQDCERLTSLDLSSFNVTNVNNMNDMFYNCRELTSLNLNGWELNDMVDTENMFSRCDNLRELYLINPDETTYMKIQNALSQSGIDSQILITK